ncbi:MAG TPA: hypothetical protein DCQ90_00345 [Erysipelotrichaceae bacterium]|nr:MAG: hypothetical protein A2Y19_09920 [Firmicutes bacterium GWE2_51_13]HAO60424.1 hypothetical protein [Erysipelotrichaceae bacterium]
MKQRFDKFYKSIIEKSLKTTDTKLMFRYIFSPMIFILITLCFFGLFVIIDSENQIISFFIENMIIIFALLLPILIAFFVFFERISQEKIRRNILLETVLDGDNANKYWKWRHQGMKILYGLWILLIIALLQEIVYSFTIEDSFTNIVFLLILVIVLIISIFAIVKRDKHVLAKRTAIISTTGVYYVGDVFLWERDSGNTIYSMKYYPRDGKTLAVFELKLELWGRYGHSLHDFIYPISQENESKMDSIQQILQDLKREQDVWKKLK